MPPQLQRRRMAHHVKRSIPRKLQQNALPRSRPAAQHASLRQLRADPHDDRRTLAEEIPRLRASSDLSVRTPTAERPSLVDSQNPSRLPSLPHPRRFPVTTPLCAMLREGPLSMFGEPNPPFQTGTSRRTNDAPLSPGNSSPPPTHPPRIPAIVSCICRRTNPTRGITGNPRSRRIPFTHPRD